MARSGRFGRLPRAAPNLTSALISLLREVASQQDSNILKAWQEGGEYEGKPVSDEMLLAHLRSRRDGVDPKDPLWDRWNTALTNYTFAIEESKIQLRYANDEVDDNAMAAFYTEWSRKLPPDSEAHRNLLRSAAQFLDAAKAKAEQKQRDETQATIERIEYQFRAGEISAGQAAAQMRALAGQYRDTDQATYYRLLQSALAFDKAGQAAAGGGGGGGGGGRGRGRGGGGDIPLDAMQQAYDRHERAYDTAAQVLLAAAYEAGILQETDTSDPDDLDDLRVGDEQDHARFIALFNRIYNDPTFGRAADGSYPYREALADVGLQRLTYGAWVDMAASKTQGIEARIALARASGASNSEISDLEEELVEHQRRAVRAGDIDVMAAYQTSRRQLQIIAETPGMTPWQYMAAMDRHSRLLGDLLPLTGAAENKGFMNNELAALTGQSVLTEGVGPTPYEANEGGIRTLGDDAGALAQWRNDTAQRIAMVESGRAFLTKSRDPDGTEWVDVIPANAPIIQDRTAGFVMFMDRGDGAGAPIYVETRGIYSEAGRADPRTRNLSDKGVEATGDPLIGHYFEWNGQTYYGIYRNDGSGDLVWFNDPSDIISGNTTTTLDPDGNMFLRWETTTSRYDPAQIINWGLMDDNIPWSGRWDNPEEAVYDTDITTARALLKTPPRAVVVAALAQFPNSPEDASQYYDNFVGERDQSVHAANSRYFRMYREAQRLGIEGLTPEAVLRDREVERFFLTPSRERLGAEGMWLSPEAEERARWNRDDTVTINPEKAAEAANRRAENAYRERARQMLMGPGVYEPTTAMAAAEALPLRIPGMPASLNPLGAFVQQATGQALGEAPARVEPGMRVKPAKANVLPPVAPRLAATPGPYNIDQRVDPNRVASGVAPALPAPAIRPAAPPPLAPTRALEVRPIDQRVPDIKVPETPKPPERPSLRRAEFTRRQMEVIRRRYTRR